MKRRQFLVLSGLRELGINSVSRLGQANAHPSQTSPLFCFIALGNVGTGERGQYATANAMNRHFDCSSFSSVLPNGDNIYSTGKIARIGEVFQRPYLYLRQQGIPFYAVLGNHNVQTNNGDDQMRYLELFGV